MRKAGSCTGAVVAIAGVVLADASSQGASTGNLRGTSCLAGLVGILAFVGGLSLTTKSRRGGDSGGQSQDGDEGLGKHLVDRGSS